MFVSEFQIILLKIFILLIYCTYFILYEFFEIFEKNSKIVTNKQQYFSKKFWKNSKKWLQNKRQYFLKFKKKSQKMVTNKLKEKIFVKILKKFRKNGYKQTSG